MRAAHGAADSAIGRAANVASSNVRENESGDFTRRLGEESDQSKDQDEELGI